MTVQRILLPQAQSHFVVLSLQQVQSLTIDSDAVGVGWYRQKTGESTSFCRNYGSANSAGHLLPLFRKFIL